MLFWTGDFTPATTWRLADFNKISRQALNHELKSTAYRLLITAYRFLVIIPQRLFLRIQ